MKMIDLPKMTKMVKKNSISQSSNRIEYDKYYIALLINKMNKRSVEFEGKTEYFVSWI